MFNVDTLNLNSALKPRADNILVLPLLKAGSSIIIDAGENREQPEKGIVIAVGPGGTGPDTGRAIPMISKVGELVAYGKFAGLAWEIAGPEGDTKPVKVFILRDSEVLLAQAPEDVELEIHDNDPRKMHEKGLTCEFCAVVTGEAGVERLRLIAAGGDPDAPASDDVTPSAIEQERERLRQARERDASEPASVKG